MNTMLKKVTLGSSILLLLFTFIPWPNFFNYFLLALISFGLWFITVPILLINPVMSIIFAIKKAELTKSRQVYFLLSTLINILALFLLIVLFVVGLSNGFQITE